MKKRLFGVPVAMIVAALIVGLMGVSALAAYYFSQTNPATVQVLVTELAVYEDEECTIPLEATAVFDFGTIRLEEVSSNTETFYVKNIGDDTLRVMMWQTGLGVDLTLMEAARGVVGDESAKVDLGGTISLTIAHTTTTTAGITALSTGIPLADVTGWPTSGIIKIDDEFISYGGIQELSLTPCTRGLYGSVAAPHAIGVEVNEGEVEFSLESEAVASVTLSLEAGAAPERGTEDFQIWIDGQLAP